MRLPLLTRIVAIIVLVALVAFFVDVYAEAGALGRYTGDIAMGGAAVLAILGFAGRRWALGITAAIGAIGFVLWFFFVVPSEIPLAKAGMAVFGSLIAGIIGLFPARRKD